MTVKVSIEGYGQFEIHSSKVNELLNWIKNNQLPLTEVIKNTQGQMIYE